MATTLSHSSIEFALLNAPPPSQDPISLRQVPDVFVIPPEEEQDINPPWCYFDSTEAKVGLATSPDIDALDVALGLFQQTDNRAPTFHRSHSNESSDTIVMPKRSLNDALGTDIDVMRDNIMEARSSSRRGIDEDVVEVIKVRRNEGMSDVTDGKGLTLKKSKTFKARATQALRSLKNVGKNNRKPVMEIWPAPNGSENDNHAEGGPIPRPSTPNLTRRKSATLTHLFSTTRSSSRSSSEHPPASPLRSVIPSYAVESPLPTSRQPSSSLGDRTNIHTNARESQEHVNPTLSKRKSFRNRISVLDLHRFFTPSSSVASDTVTPKASQENMRTLSRSAKHSSLPLSPSRSSNLFTPDSVDDIFSSNGSNHRPHSFHDANTRPSLALSTGSSNGSSLLRREFEEDIILETSFELRLDSLHFDSLHFDPDEYEF